MRAILLPLTISIAAAHQAHATTYTIGGTVTGLTASESLVLLLNGHDALTVTTPGAFKIGSAVATGVSYAVTVETQPTGETCPVVNGTGKIGASDVTNIEVQCTVNAVPGVSFWEPFLASPFNGSKSGKTGLFLIASNSLESEPVPEFVTTVAAQPVGLTLQYTFSSGQLTYVPALMMYAAVGSDGETHIYGINLGNTAAVPKPVQIGSLALPSTKQICGGREAETSLATPDTMFVVLQVTAAGKCATGAATFYVVHYTDAATTAPLTAAIGSNLFDSIYHDGTLKGMLLADTTTHTLNLYPTSAFTSPTVLLSGVTASLGIASASIPDGSEYGSNAFYLSVTTGSGPALYRVAGATGAIEEIHKGAIGSSAVDAYRLYFADVTNPAKTVLYEVSLTGTTPKTLYAGSTPAGSEYQLYGTSDSLLTFQDSSFSASGPQATFYTVPDDSGSSAPNPIAGPYAGIATAAFLAAPAPGEASKSLLYQTIRSQTGAKVSYSSVAVPPGGPLGESVLANSAYESFGVLTSQLTGTVWRVTGITDTNGAWGGGKISQVNVGSGTTTIATTAGGADYVIPASYLGALSAYASNAVAFGTLAQPTATPTAPDVGLGYDLEKNFALPIGIANTNVDAF
jgi:hypothetical protein